jgi:SAM-dependent methyltransferase
MFRTSGSSRILVMAGVEDIYRDEFLARVLAGRPRSLLEVGSGSGTFLRSLKGGIDRVAGIDPNADNVEAVRAEGFEVVLGKAEALPFQNGEFDVVVFSFTPHHMSDWTLALKEAMRVARHSIEILDVWYDDGVPDQRVAHDFDRWCKEIDRRSGMVHNDTLPPGALLQPIIEGRGLTYDYVCRRVSAMCNLDEILSTGEAQLAMVGDDAVLKKGFEQIVEDARRYGMSEEGCVQMTIELGR